MKIKEIINEGMTFGPARIVHKNGEKYITGEEWWKKEEQECPFCDGTGQQEWGDEKRECGYCYGKGKSMEHVSTAPELQVSNANGYAIQAMLGVEPDYSGHIEPKDLPKLMQKLIKLKNSSLDQYTEDPRIDNPTMQRLPDENGVAKIGKSGPTMVHGGRSHAQVERYIDKLIDIVRFAQQNNAAISWA